MGGLGVIQGNYEITRKCYVESLMLKRVRIVGVNIVHTKTKVKPLEKVSTKEDITNPDEESVKYVEEYFLS